jgi:hypothetical protein
MAMGSKTMMTSSRMCRRTIRIITSLASIAPSLLRMDTSPHSMIDGQSIVVIVSTLPASVTALLPKRFEIQRRRSV